MATTDSKRTMLVEVNDQLHDALVTTSRIISELEAEAVGCRGGVLNDRQHYERVVVTLEQLAIAALSATSSVSLLDRYGVTGARLDLGAGSQAATAVNESVAYLRDEAAELLARKQFGAHNTGHVTAALGMLNMLHRALVGGVTAQATADVRKLRQLDTGLLLIAAKELAESAAAVDPRPTFDAREASVSNPDPRPREEREGTWNPAG